VEAKEEVKEVKAEEGLQRLVAKGPDGNSWAMACGRPCPGMETNGLQPQQEEEAGAKTRHNPSPSPGQIQRQGRRQQARRYIAPLVAKDGGLSTSSRMGTGATSDKCGSHYKPSSLVGIGLDGNAGAKPPIVAAMPPKAANGAPTFAKVVAKKDPEAWKELEEQYEEAKKRKWCHLVATLERDYPELVKEEKKPLLPLPDGAESQSEGLQQATTG